MKRNNILRARAEPNAKSTDDAAPGKVTLRDRTNCCQGICMLWGLGGSILVMFMFMAMQHVWLPGDDYFSTSTNNNKLVVDSLTASAPSVGTSEQKKIGTGNHRQENINSTLAVAAGNDDDDEVCRFVDLVVLSDRENSEVPLRALVNSLLRYTLNPIHLNVVVSYANYNQNAVNVNVNVNTNNTLKWLRDLNGTTDHFRITFHHSERLLRRSMALVKSASLQLGHPSSQFAIQKLYLSTDLPNLTASSPRNQQVLMIDDDQIFLEDITPLFRLIHDRPNDVALLCTPDKFNLRKICKKPGLAHNCDDTLYCVTGLVGFPVSSNNDVPHNNKHNNNTTNNAKQWLVEQLEQSAHEMMVEYPNSTITQADQDIFNRFFRSQQRQRRHGGGGGGVHTLPCEWSCGTDECGKRFRHCRSCDIDRCKALHFQVKAYQEHLPPRKNNQTWSWDYYFRMDSRTLLEEFHDRIHVLKACGTAGRNSMLPN